MRVHDRMRSLAFALVAASIAGCVTPDEPELAAKAIGIPPTWQGSIGASSLYEIGLDRADRHGGRSAAYMTGPANFTTEVALLEQPLRVDNYRGRRVRLSAWVKGRELIGPIAGLWMRVDGAGVVTGYDNMSARAETGTTDWHRISVVLDVPSDALGIVIGAMRQGGGTLFIDDMKLESVGTDIASTNMFDAPRANTIDPATTAATYLNAPTSPTNTDFERKP
jgi:hypothetical protein